MQRWTTSAAPPRSVRPFRRPRLVGLAERRFGVGRTGHANSGRYVVAAWRRAFFASAPPCGSTKDRSCVPRVAGQSKSRLLTGHIEEVAEQWRLQHAYVQAEIVRVLHHGSTSSSTGAFVEATDWSMPAFSIAGAFAARGFGSRAVGRRYGSARGIASRCMAVCAPSVPNNGHLRSRRGNSSRPDQCPVHSGGRQSGQNHSQLLA